MKKLPKTVDVLVDIPDWCKTIYDWANYELNDEVYNSIEELE